MVLINGPRGVKKQNIGLQFLATGLSKSGAFHENRKNQIYELLGDHQV